MFTSRAASHDQFHKGTLLPLHLHILCPRHEATTTRARLVLESRAGWLGCVYPATLTMILTLSDVGWSDHTYCVCTGYPLPIFQRYNNPRHSTRKAIAISTSIPPRMYKVKDTPATHNGVCSPSSTLPDLLTCYLKQQIIIDQIASNPAEDHFIIAATGSGKSLLFEVRKRP